MTPLTCDQLNALLGDILDDAVELHVRAEEINADRSAGVDRYLIYHGAAQGVEARSRATRWARFNILGARYAGLVYDDLRAINTIHDQEAGLCKQAFI